MATELEGGGGGSVRPWWPGQLMVARELTDPKIILIVKKNNAMTLTLKTHI